MIINNNKIIEDLKEIFEKNKIEDKLKNLMNIYDKMNDNNYIISEIDIKKEDINEDIQIINSFENLVRKYGKELNIKEEDYYKYENEKEIKENYKIKINDKIIPFSYNYKFDKEGKYIIKYSFINNLSKTDCMFYECESLTNINLSNFNTQNVTDMSGMFDGCNSLRKENVITNDEKILNEVK